jgi:hypothetical protein
VLEAEGKAPTCMVTQRQAVQRMVCYWQQNRPNMPYEEYIACGVKDVVTYPVLADGEFPMRGSLRPQVPAAVDDLRPVVEVRLVVSRAAGSSRRGC